jgi:hypothetical protein
MAKKFKPLDLSKLKTYSLSDRPSKVKTDDFARIWQKGSSFRVFLDSLPDILAGRDLREVISAIAAAHVDNRTIIFGMGAHVIKVGLNPIVIDLMERGLITAVAMNGAGIIHDAELAMIGKTSEDVASALGDGTFGMARETGNFLGEAIKTVKGHKTGLGEAVGQAIIDQQLPMMDQSILAAGVRLDIPVTVHVAIGTDFTEGQPREFFDWLLSGKSERGPAMALDFPIQNPQGIQNSADFPNLTDALLNRGYSESEARQILGENMIRLFKDVWNE